jgi:hypothetical protein
MIIDGKTKKKLGFLLSENPDHLPKNEPFSQEIHLKIQLLSRGSKLSYSKPGCEVSALHFFVK